MVYLTHYCEYPIYEPAEGGYYYAGREADASYECETMEEAMEQYELCDKKIRERGHSIVGAANRLIDLGVPKNTKKPLPAEIGLEEVECQ